MHLILAINNRVVGQYKGLMVFVAFFFMRKFLASMGFAFFFHGRDPWDLNSRPSEYQLDALTIRLLGP